MKVALPRDVTALENLIRSDDLIKKSFKVGELDVAVAYADAMTNKLELFEGVIKRLTALDAIMPEMEFMQNILPYPEDLAVKNSIEELAQSVAEGDVALFVEGADGFFVISLRSFYQRAVEEPPTSSVLKGPREGFVENIKINITLMRRRLKTPALKIKMLKIGRYSNTSVAVVHVDGIADNELVAKIFDRLSDIDIDGIIDSSYVSQYLKENKYSLFEQIGNSEKPDIVTAKLLEGRVAIIVDGSPMVLTLPYMLLENFQDGNDYFTTDIRASFLRGIRLISTFFAVFLPAMYVAMQEFHYHLLPLKFLITIQNSINGIPFTPPMEMLVVLLLFEVLHQASIRMPKFLGVALSIVGAIVLGETAVNAGLISSPAVLIIALSAMGVNCTPDEIGTFSVLRITNLLLASVLGLFGIIIFFMLVITYLSSMEAYGTPYLAPMAPIISSDLKDTLLKANLEDMKKRPYSLPNRNRHRMD